MSNRPDVEAIRERAERALRHYWAGTAEHESAADVLALLADRAALLEAVQTYIAADEKYQRRIDTADLRTALARLSSENPAG